MRFATFNVHSGRSPRDGRFDADRFAAAIAALDADVLALQEVDRDQPRSGGLDLAAVAARALDAPHCVFVPTLYGTPGRRWHAAGERPEGGPAYGCALVSRRPLRDVSTFRMPGVPVAVPLWAPGGEGLVVLREEPRVAIVATVDTGTGDGVTVVATHLPFVPGWNRIQLRRVIASVARRRGPVLLLGDLNLRAGRSVRLPGWTSLATAATFPADRPRLQLDHVLLRGPRERLGTVTASAAPALPVSDHRPLVVDVELAT